MNAEQVSWNKPLRDVIEELTQRLHKEGLVDESFGANPTASELWNMKMADSPPQWIACFAVSGGSEGHYIHVDFYMNGYDEDGTSSPVHHIALGKTFRGLAHAYKIAQRCAELLGA